MLQIISVWFFVVLIAIPAWATDIYRCTDKDGHVEYRDTACADESGRKITLQPNVTSEIDQRAARAAIKAIEDRAAARVPVEERTASDRAARERRPSPETAQTAPPLWWQQPGPPPDREKSPGAGPDQNPPSVQPPPAVVPPKAPPVRPIPGR